MTLPNTTNLSLNSGKKVAFNKNTGGENSLMFLLAILFAGTALIWLASDWYLHQHNKHLWQSWHDLTNHISSFASTWTRPNALELAENESALDTAKQPNADFLPAGSIAGNNIKTWQQTMHSIEELNKQATTAGGQPSYHNRLGILYAQADDFAAALKQFNQAIILCRKQIWQKTRQPSSSDLSSLYVELTCAHSNLARIYDRLGDHDRVIAELEELSTDMTFAGDTPPHHQLVHKSVLSNPIPNPTNQNRLVANPTLSPATASANHHGLTAEEAALFARAEALRQVGQLPQAMQAYTDLIKSHPNFALAHQRLGLAAIANNDLGLAMNELQTAITLDSKDPDTYNDLGLVYRQLGDYQSAKQAFGQAHSVDPKHLSASMNFADSLASTGSLGSALRVLQQATIYHPDSPAAHNDLAALYARTGNDKAAAKEFAQTLSLNSGLASAHYGLGVASLNLKSYPKAINELETAQKLNPGILDLQNKLDLANSSNSKELASAQGTEY